MANRIAPSFSSQAHRQVGLLVAAVLMAAVLSSCGGLFEESADSAAETTNTINSEVEPEDDVTTTTTENEVAEPEEVATVQSLVGVPVDSAYEASFGEYYTDDNDKWDGPDIAAAVSFALIEDPEDANDEDEAFSYKLNKDEASCTGNDFVERAGEQTLMQVGFTSATAVAAPLDLQTLLPDAINEDFYKSYVGCLETDHIGRFWIQEVPVELPVGVQRCIGSERREQTLGTLIEAVGGVAPEIVKPEQPIEGSETAETEFDDSPAADYLACVTGPNRIAFIGDLYTEAFGEELEKAELKCMGDDLGTDAAFVQIVEIILTHNDLGKANGPELVDAAKAACDEEAAS